MKTVCRLCSLLLVGCLVTAAGVGGAARADNRPNVVLIYADDMGYGDAGCYGDTNLVPTPHIDRLAAGGVRFTSGYVTAPICGPSRYGLLMGAYPQRIGVQNNWDTFGNLGSGDTGETPENNRLGEHRLVNQALSAAGYRSGLVGKYNLPGYPRTSFDESHSVMFFAGDYFPDHTGFYDGVGRQTDGSNKEIYWGPLRKGDEYLTDRLGRQSVEFIERETEADNPFFLYLAFNAPHSPMQAKIVHRGVVKHLKTEATKMYGAMLYSMDENIGLVLDALDRLGIADNTIVVFASDNGPSFAYNVEWPEDWPRELMGSAGPLRGHKGQYYEGGIRVPFIMRWPDRLKAGSTYDRAVSTLDLYPTFCAAAGAPIPDNTRLDGVNLLPYLSGEKAGDPHEVLYWSNAGRGAVRRGDWKLYAGQPGGKPQLYNLADDLAETRNLAAKHPDVLAELHQAYRGFVESHPPQLYKGKLPNYAK